MCSVWLPFNQLANEQPRKKAPAFPGCLFRTLIHEVKKDDAEGLAKLLDGLDGGTSWQDRLSLKRWVLRPGDWAIPSAGYQLPCGCGSKNRYQTGTLASGNMHQNLRNPSSLILSHTHVSSDDSGPRSFERERMAWHI